jgi:hypothetical protein
LTGDATERERTPNALRDAVVRVGEARSAVCAALAVLDVDTTLSRAQRLAVEARLIACRALIEQTERSVIAAWRAGFEGGRPESRGLSARWRLRRVKDHR